MMGSIFFLRDFFFEFVVLNIVLNTFILSSFEAYFENENDVTTRNFFFASFCEFRPKLVLEQKWCQDYLNNKT